LQALLLQSILTLLWARPQTQPAPSWGPALRDRFLLPRVLEADLDEVLQELGAAGLGLEPDWFQAWFDLRFPVLGAVQHEGVRLALRSALEPWPLLAEEVTAGGVARFIDMANARIEVRLEGMTPGRHVVLCNGRRVPLHETGVRGEAVAGVRYKVWEPPSTLHPLLPAVSGLQFDLVDAWTGNVLVGCSYYPPRPGVWGPSAAAPAPAAFPPGVSAAERPLPATAMVPVEYVAGGFREGGSGRRVEVPDERYDPRMPYSLDLVWRA
jgi:uncharacterized protein (DUF2126 family)